MHREQPSMAAQPCMALRLSDKTRSKGGAAGDDALCSAWRDWRQAVKQVHDPPLPVDGDDLWRPLLGRMLGVAVGLGK